MSEYTEAIPRSRNRNMTIDGERCPWCRSRMERVDEITVRSGYAARNCNGVAFCPGCSHAERVRA